MRKQLLARCGVILQAFDGNVIIYIMEISDIDVVRIACNSIIRDKMAERQNMHRMYTITLFDEFAKCTGGKLAPISFFMMHHIASKSE
eukprot:CAMPEP_0114315848 /NCGR_PEP_ID=MMETSP0059-20121206/22827_1 /TAXON_ID=36894 /ORGANISM="Pyramimonas parkeae, Strain CCMP726" /LENGTH=87 /DNA_ID=CAMNT_0001441617 /DNA_START=581 /DNA_END=844 /DNA_ORIENTATION=+